MLKTTFKISIAVALLTVGAIAGGHGKGHHNESTEMSQEKSHGKSHKEEHKQNNKESIDDNKETTTPELTDEAKAGIIYMIEEEKVAHDVYRHLAETWAETTIFSKIADSEQKHVDAVANLVGSYELELPMTLDEEGIFTNEKLQEMYNELIAKGDTSLKDALEVGVEIEETDIEDLEALLDSDLDENVEKVYSRLLRASFSHLRSFNRELDK
jgi:hypothetical protein